jgi:hypothetical protein
MNPLFCDAEVFRSRLSEQFDLQGGVGAEFGLAPRRRRFNDVVARAATLRPHALVEVPAPWLARDPARDTR